MRGIKAFIFDLDGVLTESAEQHFLAWKKLAEELGIDINREFNEKLKGVSRMESLEKILKKGNRQADFTGEEKVALATKKNENYLEMIKSFTPENLYPGVEELLKELKARNIKIALGSASKNGPRLIKAMEIDKYFDLIVDPSTVKGKPAPDIFLRAAELLQVNPRECVGVEDSVSGIKAIKAANMLAIGIGCSDILKEADIVYPETRNIDLTEIENLLN